MAIGVCSRCTSARRSRRRAGLVSLYREDKTTGDLESLDVVTRDDNAGPAVRVSGHQTLTEEAARGDAWVGAMLTLAEKVGVHHGVIPVMIPRAMRSEATMGGIFRNGIDQYPFPDQQARMRAAGRELGSKYVRFPRWGTLYGRNHVEALGGLGKIVDTVKPAVVRELPAALYVQLTDSVATATSAEAAEKQRAFTELMAPLLPPAVES